MIMKKKFLFVMALAAMVSCSSDEFVGDGASPNTGTGAQRAISFGGATSSVTRAVGSDAATNLGQQFIVWGEKNESGGTAVIVPSTNIVFPNYQVNWVSNAYSTTSNSHGWEYVGYTHSNTANTDDYKTNISPSLSAAQEIKYWDINATNYVFTAISAQKSDIQTGKVQISKTLSGTNEYSKGYTITTAAGADFTKLFIADRIYNTTKTSPVTFTFRNVLSQIRVGIYETVPGYGISSITFYVNTSDVSPTQSEAAMVSTAKAFGAVCPNVMASGAHTLTVTYGDGSTFTENQPIITSSVSSSNNLILGTNNNLILGTNTNTLTTTGTPKYLGTTATSPTWDTDGGSFTAVFPQINNTTNLSLKCDYTLYNSSTGETINISGKTATVPAKYLQWKPNYKYTYLFKITDDDLTPITFDAITIEAEDGVAEYITIVNEPSITTFGVKSSKYTTEKDEYEAGTDIYATITTSSGVVTPTLGTNVNVYVATTSDASFPVTEASVAESIANPGASPKVTCTKINDDATTYFTAAPANATEVPREDGGYISTSVDLNSEPSGWPTGYYTDERCTTAATTYSNGTYYQKWTDALKLTGVKNPNTPTYYVIEYIDGGNKTYKVIKVVAATP